MYHVAVILTDAQKNIVWVNDDFTFITGYHLTEVIGQSPGRLLQGPGTEPEAVERIRQGLRSGESFRDTLTNYRKNGEAYPCKLVIHPIYNPAGDLVNFIAFEVDGSKVENEERIPLMRLNNKYRSSSLRGRDELELFDRIRRVIEQNELYADPTLSLSRLAQMVDTNTKYLSQVINHCSGYNFQGFINHYRIEAVKRRLRQGDHQNLTFYGIAQICGFKNKSTFYKVFKDMTDQTPKDYAMSVN